LVNGITEDGKILVRVIGVVIQVIVELAVSILTKIVVRIENLIIHHMYIRQFVDEVLVIGLVILDIIIVIEVVLLIVLQQPSLVSIVVVPLLVLTPNEIRELLLGFVLIIDV
jgi:hypothetical protein